MSIFWSIITGAILAIIGSACANYLEFLKEQKEQTIEIKRNIYIDFREMYYITRTLIAQGNYEKLNNLSSEENYKDNANIIARAEIYLSADIVDEMRESVRLWAELYTPIKEINELKTKCDMAQSKSDELLLIIKKDLKIK